MNALLLLIPLSIVLLVGAGWALFWAVDHGQFEDMETPGLLPLTDADHVLPQTRADSALADMRNPAGPPP